MLSKKKGYFVFCFIGFCFFFFCITGYHLAKNENILWTGRYVVLVCVASLVLGCLAGGLLCSFFYRKEKGPYNKEGRTEKACQEFLPAKLLRWKTSFMGKTDKFARRLPKTAGCFFLSWVLIICCWMPGYLAYFPAICSYDTPIQISQILSGEYIDHHPLAHTLLLRGSLWLGENVLGSGNGGIALFAFVQLAALAAVFALGIALLRSRNAGWMGLLFLLLYAIFFPFHMYMGVSMTKDTLFSVFMLAALFALFEILEEAGQKRSVLWDVFFGISVIGMVLFRNNGKYAMLVLLVFTIMAAIFGRRRRRRFVRILAAGAFGLLAGSLLLTGVFRVLNAQSGDKREMLSMPIQQLARTMIYHGGAGVLPVDDNTMEEQDKALINDFILNQAYTQYRPDISDPVKKNTNTYVVRYRLPEFAKTYVHLLTQYPGDFINAALSVNAGYLYPGDKSHAYINVKASEHGMGYVQTRWVEEEMAAAGVYKDTRWSWLHDRLEEFADSNAYLSIPVLKYLFVPGTYLWFWLLLAGWLTLHRQYRLLLPLTLVLGYYLTLFLGPTVQLRYIYPVMTALPFLLVWCVSIVKKE